MTIKIPPERMVDAKYVTGWNISLFGNPKLTIQCGKCFSLFKTRDYIPCNDLGGQLLAPCPFCGFWINTKLVF